MRDKLDKKWQMIMDQLDEEHPEIEPNHFKFLYVGNKEFIYDINNHSDEDTFIDALEPEEEEDSEGETERRRELGSNMFEALPEGTVRDIFDLHYNGGFGWTQIGEKLNMSKQLVYYHYKKNLELLRSLYISEDNEE
jgi:DNA-directed RNA polymerase specialized sigma subunit